MQPPASAVRASEFLATHDRAVVWMDRMSGKTTLLLNALVDDALRWPDRRAKMHIPAVTRRHSLEMVQKIRRLLGERGLDSDVVAGIRFCSRGFGMPDDALVYADDFAFLRLEVRPSWPIIRAVSTPRGWLANGRPVAVPRLEGIDSIDLQMDLNAQAHA